MATNTTMDVMIDGKIEQRTFHIEVDKTIYYGYQNNRRRIAPDLLEGEAVVWVVGNNIPGIVRFK